MDLGSQRALGQKKKKEIFSFESEEEDSWIMCSQAVCRLLWVKGNCGSLDNLSLPREVPDIVL